jgi:glycosyltransferase involved in cell wall biosynthesis
MKLSVIIPTFNEASNCRVVIPQIHEALRTNYTIVIVDDSSPDGTQSVIQELSTVYPIKLVSRPEKGGLASAVIDGMKAVEADAYIIMDADLSHPPQMLPELRNQIETHDLVVASRYVEGGSTSGWPLKRRVISRLAIMLARPLTPIKDATSGFFAIRRECVQNVNLTPLGFKIGLECFVKADWRSAQEVPFVFTDRRHGESKLNQREFVAYIRQLLHLYAYAFGRFSRSLASRQSSSRRCDDADYEWASWHRGNPVQRWWKRNLASKVVNCCTLPPTARVLDMGCGSSPLITLLGDDCIGIDTNESKLKFMRRRCTSSCLNMDVRALAFKNDSFDHVVCIEVLEHVNDPWLAISELSRVLKPQGTAVIATPDYTTLRWKMVEKLYAIAMPNAYADEHVTKLNRETLIDLCREHRLTHTGTQYLLGADMVLSFRKS